MFPPVFVGKTDFPLRPTANDHEPVPGLAVSMGGPSFHLLDGPPYANGSPHLGHVLNKHLKDAVCRAMQTMGHSTQWRPGWDCHGLPLELAVEKTGVSRVDRAAFVSAARDYASTQAAHQSLVFQQQGWCAQWDNPWHTQDPGMEAGTLRVLAKLLDAGLLDVRFASVPWCPACGSTLSNAEQEDKVSKGVSWLVPFYLDSGQALLSWTTTPWTLPLHRALVVNPHARYVLLDLDGNQAWVSEHSSQRWALSLGATVTSFSCLGSDLAGLQYSSPWVSAAVQSDEAVLEDAGTGVLHAVPGLAELDTSLAKGHGWDVVQHLGVHGQVLRTPCADQEGLKAGPAANVPVRGSYESSPWFKEMPHEVLHPHCWRHHTPLLTRASRQVFLHLTLDVRQRAQRMLGKLEFSPENARARLHAAMLDRPDWCLSRQRSWGVPLALFLDRSTGKPHACASTVMRRVADEVEQSGVGVWWRLPSSHWLGDDARQEDVDRVDDVLDVWFDSGCVPQLLGPADMVVEGTDQHRGWFQSCLWVAAALDADLPFKKVVTHGFVVDHSGEKLSKSRGGDASSKKGAGVAKWDALPSDVVRVWALAGTDGHDKAWTQDTVQQAQGWVSRWRGVMRFLLANVLPSTTAGSPVLRDLPAWDLYWVSQCRLASTDVRTLMSKARFGEAVARAAAFGEQFSSHALGSWKDRLYCAPPSTQERQALDLVLRECLLAWGEMLEVLTPRMRQEASSFWPLVHGRLVHQELSLEQQQEVECVLALRQSLAVHAEALNKTHKGGSGLRVVSRCAALPSWPGQMLADALDVGQVLDDDGGLPKVQVCVDGRSFLLGFGPARDAQCPRCRRAQPAWEGSCCAVCASRAGP